MFSASRLIRIFGCLVVASAFALAQPTAHSQTIDVSLNVLYDDPGSMLSGGTWQVVAKSSAAGGYFGIAVLNVHLTNVHPATPDTFQVEAPRGIVNQSDVAGFTVDLFNATGYRTLSAAQVALAFEPGEEGAFYGVGTIANGTPGDIGPMYTTLTGVQGAPWGTGDIFNDSAWAMGVLLASGTFSENVTPGFTGVSNGSVYDELGTLTMVGPTVSAAISTVVRTNFDPSAGLPDYNGNGVVDAADYVLWRKGAMDADGNGNGMIDQGDYDRWRERFGQSASPGSGSGGVVPEPASALIVIVGGFLGLFARRRRGRALDWLGVRR